MAIFVRFVAPDVNNGILTAKNAVMLYGNHIFKVKGSMADMRNGLRLFVLLALLVAPGVVLAETRVIHVLVALCDNASQGIVPVPAKIGNGDDPANNLYWGCAYGVSAYMQKQPGWTLVRKIKDPQPGIYERLVFKAKNHDVYMVADAYAGREIRQTTIDLLDFAAGLRPVAVTLEDGGAVSAGGGADLLVYVGHNGLMDFTLERIPVFVDAKSRDVAVFACASKQYFEQVITLTGAHPLALTTNLMSPEAYSLAALAEGWINGESAAQIHERLAQAYHKYQKCGLKGARNLFSCMDRE